MNSYTFPEFNATDDTQFYIPSSPPAHNCEEQSYTKPADDLLYLDGSFNQQGCESPVSVMEAWPQTVAT